MVDEQRLEIADGMAVGLPIESRFDDGSVSALHESESARWILDDNGMVWHGNSLTIPMAWK